MVRNKGVSMISLVISIIVTIILIGIATTAGYKYVIEGNKVKQNAVVKVISDAAYRRQNDFSTGVSDATYAGYKFDIMGTKGNYNLIEGLPDEYAAGDPDVPDCLEETGARWYIFDAESATRLGVSETEKFISRNISYLAAIKEKEVKLVLSDYTTGDGYFIKIPKDALKDSIKQDTGCMNSPTGNHDFKVATCTEPSKCKHCGISDPDGPALGHNFAPPTCTADGYCLRCNAIDPDNGKLGHEMIKNADINDASLVKRLNDRDCMIFANTSNGASADSATTEAWIADRNKHWHECKRCETKSKEEKHTAVFISVNDKSHHLLCLECAWYSADTAHNFEYIVMDDKHQKKCEDCEYLDEHSNSAWIEGNKDYHYKECTNTEKCYTEMMLVKGQEKKIIAKEAHYDLNNDVICDAYDCKFIIDRDSPEPFNNHYANMVSATTSTITVQAYTEDEKSGVAYYQFGIYNNETKRIEWSENVVPSGDKKPAEITFKGLTPDTDYDIYVKAFDKAENSTPQHKIPNTKTAKFPLFNGLTGLPTTYVASPLSIGIAPIDTNATDVSIEYSLDGTNWSSIAINDIKTAKIELTKELEKVRIRFSDSAGNKGDVKEYTIEKIDATAPTVTIEPKAGDNNTTNALQHVAVVTISDAKSGIEPDTAVRYAWSTSNTVVPTSYNTAYTKNAENVSRVSFEVTTPADVTGRYYLWILDGVSDKVGNVTEEAKCSNDYFAVDDAVAGLSNIKMLSEEPIVADENLFANVGRFVTIRFETDRPLADSPSVTLNGNEVNVTTTDDVHYLGAIKLTDSFKEGILQLEITNVVAETGKVNRKTYTNDDLVEGPVIFDKTPPVFEYISKK